MEAPARKLHTKKLILDNHPGFDVTCIIGHVDLTGTGDETPDEAAFRLIGQHRAEGTYNFPHEDGRTISVTVDYISDTPQED